MLTEEMKTKILEFVDSIEIDVEELDSFTYDRVSVKYGFWGSGLG